LRLAVVACTLGFLACTASLSAQQPDPTKAASAAQDTAANAGAQPPFVFDMGEIVVVGSPEGQPGVGGYVLSSEQIWMFDTAPALERRRRIRISVLSAPRTWSWGGAAARDSA